jgi:hypothetical protein
MAWPDFTAILERRATHLFACSCMPDDRHNGEADLGKDNSNAYFLFFGRVIGRQRHIRSRCLTAISYHDVVLLLLIC